MRLRVQDILESKNVSYRIIELVRRAITVEDVIEYSKDDIDPDEICKTIIVKVKGVYYALFLRGKDKIDFKKLRSIIGKATIATRKEVLEITGLEPGTICPLLLDLPVIVDERALKIDKLNFGSGNHLYGIEINTNDIDLVLDYRKADFAEE